MLRTNGLGLAHSAPMSSIAVPNVLSMLAPMGLTHSAPLRTLFSN